MKTDCKCECMYSTFFYNTALKVMDKRNLLFISNCVIKGYQGVHLMLKWNTTAELNEVMTLREYKLTKFPWVYYMTLRCIWICYFKKGEVPVAIGVCVCLLWGWRIRSTMRRPKFHSRSTASMNGGRLNSSLAPFPSRTVPQHLGGRERHDAEHWPMFF